MAWLLLFPRQSSEVKGNTYGLTPAADKGALALFVVGAADQGFAGDKVEAEGVGFVANLLELRGFDIACHRLMARAGLEILAGIKDVASGLSRIAHDRFDLLHGFPKPKHKTCLGDQSGSGGLLQYRK